MSLGDGLQGVTGQAAASGIHQDSGVAGDEEGGEKGRVAACRGLALELVSEGLLERGGDFARAAGEAG